MSRIERIEGRRHAATLLQSVAGMPKAFLETSDVVNNLRATIQKRPGDWAEGVREILDLIQCGEV